jgi:hypothetical protein
MGISTFKTGLTGLMGKFLTKLNPEDQADIEAENNPGSTQARYDAMKDKVRTHDKDGNINPPTQMGTPLYQNQNQPTKGNYENPAFISRGNAFNEGAKTLLETSLNHFTNRDKEKAASNKADRQAKRSDRKTNRANARVARQDEKFEAGTSRSNKNAYGLLGQLPKSVKKSRYEKKTEKLRDDSVTLSTKSNASQLIADNLKKIREGGNTTSKLFSFTNQAFQTPKITIPSFKNISLTNKKTL